MLELNKIYNQDCLEGMKSVDDKSIDFILTDLPFGVTARNSWDSIIPFDKLWLQYERIIKDNGAIALNAIQPFASQLVCSNLKLFKYEYIWQKDYSTGFLNAKKQPLRNHEQILIFHKSPPIYNPQMTEGKPYTCKQGGHGTNYHDRGEEVKEVITVNNGTRYPVSIQKFSRDKEKFHPTQKPENLCSFLIKTYTNEGMLVLDSCAGSGTTLLAAKNLGRNYIGFENNLEYFNIATERLK